MNTLSRAVAVGLLLLAPAGCTGLSALTQVTKPTDLYDLTPKSTYDPSLPEVAAQVVIEEPTAASAVNTDRIAVRPTRYKVQYFPDARWVDRAPLLVQTMLIESFENTGKVAAVGRRTIGLNSDFTLVTDLREFQAELPAGDGQQLTITVHLNIKVVREPAGQIAASQSFLRRIPAESDDMEHIVAAFDTALGKAMGDAVEWAVREIAEIAG